MYQPCLVDWARSGCLDCYELLTVFRFYTNHSTLTGRSHPHCNTKRMGWFWKLVSFLSPYSLAIQILEEGCMYLACQQGAVDSAYTANTPVQG